MINDKKWVIIEECLLLELKCMGNLNYCVSCLKKYVNIIKNIFLMMEKIFCLVFKLILFKCSC